ncbi:hypothetical protein BOH66_01045 [Microbacterium aurum]|uniref:Uncharacterized protein n=1 Tax=Microbacterium aurum TaxID=36805 RepID=A0A1P8U4K4_9MICO|nr:hypothetical protein [Microbacterium aurum]APZ33037.1 hypothetical protein BOH66_01045 [Microbacterium aurum]MBM7826591.1 uncharacterized protein involved in cysteine biosynthesis [Microbacterium aurum]
MLITTDERTPSPRRMRTPRQRWTMFAQQQPTTAQLVVFVAINTGVTVLQLLLMPVFKATVAGGTPDSFAEREHSAPEVWLPKQPPGGWGGPAR